MGMRNLVTDLPNGHKQVGWCYFGWGKLGHSRLWVCNRSVEFRIRNHLLCIDGGCGSERMLRPNRLV